MSINWSNFGISKTQFLSKFKFLVKIKVLYGYLLVRGLVSNSNCVLRHSA